MFGHRVQAVAICAHADALVSGFREMRRAAATLRHAPH